MSDAALLTEQRGYTRILTLNRPERMNALGKEMVLHLKHELERLAFDDATRVIVIRGSGTRAFCAGADLKERAAMPEHEVGPFVAGLRATFKMLYDHPKVTIAMLNGLALGGGLELALACDLRYAARDNRKIGLTETRLAIIPGAGGTQLLARIAGAAAAKSMIFKAQPIDAEEALRLGILNQVCAADELEALVLAEAELIAANGPLALIQAKKAINQGLNMSLDQGLQFEQACYAQVIPTEDRLEGLRAFGEKRRPQYQGR